MNNPKIEKIQSDIDKTKARISEYQSRLRVLEKQKVEIENDNFINIIRSEKISDAELNALLLSLRKGETKPAEPTATAEHKTRLEETGDAKDEP